MRSRVPQPRISASSPAVQGRILYITYDGLMEPLGQSQVLQYLRQLAQIHQIVLVSYEKSHDRADRERFRVLVAEVREARIRWLPLRYHNVPPVPATAYDVIVGLLSCAYLTIRHHIKIVHARGYVAGLVALWLKWILGTRLIFDMRGFWADERVTAGIWRQNALLYRLAKRLEKCLLDNADTIVSLTHAAVPVLRSVPSLRDTSRIEVIPTCTNVDLFRPATPAVVDVVSTGRPLTLGYVGSVGTRYLFNLVLECFKIVRGFRPDARLLVINQGSHTYIRQQMKTEHIQDQWVEIKAVPYREVVNQLHRMDAGLFFYKPAFSTVATAPTKFGEFLACGLPCLVNAGIGDFDAILEVYGVGVVLRDLTPQGKERAVKQLLALIETPEVRQRCVETARHFFSLEKGVQGYDKIYRSLMGLSSPRDVWYDVPVDGMMSVQSERCAT